MIFEVSRLVLSSVVLGLLSLASTSRPPFPYLHLDPPSFLEEFRRNLPALPQSYRTQPVELDHIGADVRLTDTPLQIEAGFYLRPRYNGRGLQLLPFLPRHLLPDNFDNQRRFTKPLFTPSRRGERPETPGQVKNYEDDLKKIENERAEELTTSGYFEDDSVTSSPPSASSFVNVGVTRGNKQEYSYNYSL